MSVWRLAIGGDIMLNGIPPKAKSLAGVASVFQDADLAYANLEIPLTNQGVRTLRKTPEDLAKRTQFILRADPGHAPHLKEVGLDAVSLGNNHAMDYGFQGLLQMQGVLKKQAIAFCGAGATETGAFEIAVVRIESGLRVGFLSMLCFQSTGGLWKNTPARAASPGVAGLDLGGKVDAKAKKRLFALIRKARSSCDFLAVTPHWGLEKQSVPSPYQVALGRAFVDAGADLVVGAHPHVLQGAELYKGKPIFYSMGNLISSLPASTAVAVLEFKGSGFKKVQVLPASISGGKVRLLGGAAAENGRKSFTRLCQKLHKRYPGGQMP